jgi:hypothetical protein
MYGQIASWDYIVFASQYRDNAGSEGKEELGGSDETVPVLQTIEMAKKFYELNIIYRLVLFEEGDHYLKKHRKKVDEMRRTWFDKYLNN